MAVHERFQNIPEEDYYICLSDKNNKNTETDSCEIEKALGHLCENADQETRFKMRYIFKYNGRMSGLNEYTNANRGSKGKFFGNQTKKFWTNEIAELLHDAPKFKNPVTIKFHWVEPNAKRDPDNFIFAKKFILDGMVKAGVIENDGHKNIIAFTDTWEVDKDSEGSVLVNISEV